MFLQSLDLTTALRPLLLPEETLLFVQDAIGLYEGYAVKQRLLKHGYVVETLSSNNFSLLSRKYKLPDLQHGHAYLTSHRVCYVDKTSPRKHSYALELRHIEHYDYYVRF